MKELKVLIALIPVNKDSEQVHIGKRKKHCLVSFPCKKSVAFGSNSLKMSVSFDRNFTKVLLYSTVC